MAGNRPRRRRGRERIARPLAGILPSTALPARRRAAARAGDDYGAPGDPDWRRIDWSRHVRDVRIGGRRVRYVDLGEGPREPVVFVHGLAASWQCWLENIPAAAAQGRRVIALDIPGFGRSEMPAAKISISGWGSVLDELCERLDLGRVVLVGNSMGGFISTETAISFPQRVERLVLVSAAGLTTTSLRKRPTMTWARVQAIATTRALARQRDLIVRPRLRHALLRFVFRHPTRIPADTLYEAMRGAASPGFVDAMEALMGYDFRDSLPGIRCPTLIVWGRDDMVVPLADAYEFERLIPGTQEVVVFEDTGHVPMLERPPTFNRRLADFLAEARDSPRPARAAA